MNGLLGALRAGTAERHRALEALTGMPGSLRSRADLRRRLAQSWGFYRTLEPALTASPLWDELGLPHCRAGKLGALAQDLDALGVDARARAALPTCAAPPPPTRMGALGTGYVIEGATLGGRLMRAHVARQPEAAGMAGALRFYDGYGRATGARWRAFTDAAEALPLAAGEIDEAVTAARDTFDRLHRWLAERDRADAADGRRHGR